MNYWVNIFVRVTNIWYWKIKIFQGRIVLNGKKREFLFRNPEDRIFKFKLEEAGAIVYDVAKITLKWGTGLENLRNETVAISGNNSLRRGDKIKIIARFKTLKNGFKKFIEFKAVI